MPVLQTETRQQVNLQRSIASELDWVNSNAKGQQKKGKARLRRYEDLTQQVWHLQPPLFPTLLWLLDCSSPALLADVVWVFVNVLRSHMVCTSRLTLLNRSFHHDYKGGSVDAFMAVGNNVTECCLYTLACNLNILASICFIQGSNISVHKLQIKMPR